MSLRASKIPVLKAIQEIKIKMPRYSMDITGHTMHKTGMHIKMIVKHDDMDMLPIYKYPCVTEDEQHNTFLLKTL